jgi:hypothetical protein
MANPFHWRSRNIRQSSNHRVLCDLEGGPVCVFSFPVGIDFLSIFCRHEFHVTVGFDVRVIECALVQLRLTM